MITRITASLLIFLPCLAIAQGTRPVTSDSGGTMKAAQLHAFGASAANQDFLKQLGADEAIDYKATKFEDVGKDVDVVLDTVAGATLRRSYAIVKKGGISVSVLEPPDKAELQARGIRGTVFMARATRAAVALSSRSSGDAEGPHLSTGGVPQGEFVPCGVTAS